MELRFGGSGRHAEHLGDFFVFVAFDVVQHEHTTRTRGKSFDRFLEVEQIAGSERHSDDTSVCVHAHLLIVLLEPRLLASFGFPRVENDVDRQPVQPGRERALASEEVQLFPRADEDILGELLRPATVRNHAGTEREHPVRVVTVESFERTPVPGRRACDVRITIVQMI